MRRGLASGWRRRPDRSPPAFDGIKAARAFKATSPGRAADGGAGQSLYLDLRYVSGIPASYQCRSDELMSLSGVNLGNFVFRHAIPMIVEDFDSYRTVGYSEFLHAAEHGAVDRVLVSCANWLGTRPQDEKDNAFRAMCFEKAGAPIAAFGLGVQAAEGVSRIKLGPSTVRMAKVMSERTASLSVRDEMTQDTLARVGVRNTVVTGCPSNFINPDGALGSRISARARALIDQRTTWFEIRTLFAEASGGNEYSARVLRAQLELMASNPAFYVLQSPAILAFILGEGDELSPLYGKSDPFGDPSRLRHILRAKALHFSSVDAWMDFARTCHLSVGMRIHGAMVPLQAGVPTLIIVHDARTSGLARHMGVPTISPEDYLRVASTGPTELGAIIASTMDGYDKRRATLAAVMRDHVVANGLTPHDSLLGLIGSGTTP